MHCVIRWFSALKSCTRFIFILLASLLGVYFEYESMASNYGIIFALKECYCYEAGSKEHIVELENP